MKKHVSLFCLAGLVGSLTVSHTLSGQTTPDYNTGVFGNSVKFRAAGAPLSISQFGTTKEFFFGGTFTVEFWAKVTPDYASGSSQWIQQEDGSISVGLVNFCTDYTCTELAPLPNIIFSLFSEADDTGPGEFSCFAEIPAYNEWFHVALVCNQNFGDSPATNEPGFGQMNIFINGYPAGIPLPAPPVNTVRYSDKPLLIGHHARNFFIDELRLWEIAKLGTGIRARMNQETETNASGLVAYYSFNAPATPAGSGAGKTFPNLSTGAGSPGSDLNGSMGANPFGFSIYPEFRQDRTFIATSGGDWNDPAIWGDGSQGIPDADETVTIDLPSAYDEIVLRGPLYANSIVFKNGRILTNGFMLNTYTVTAGASRYSYIVTDNGDDLGEGMYRISEAGWTYALLPIGNAQDYLPIKIRNGGSGNSGYTFYAEARVKDLMTSIIEPDAALDVPWELKAGVLSEGVQIDYQVKFHWYAHNEGRDFDRNQVYIANYHDGYWRRLGTGAPAEEAGDNLYAAAVMVREFSEFTGTSSEDVPLPVGLMKLRAAYEGKIPVLSWSTTFEANSDRFEVRSGLLSTAVKPGRIIFRMSIFMAMEKSTTG